jgi:hypothetical protein
MATTRYSHLAGVLDAEIAQSADALNDHEASWCWSRMAEGVERGQAGAQQRDLNHIEALWDGDKAAGAHFNDLGVAAVDGRSRPWLIGAV